MKVGLIGLGRMGEGMSRRMMKAGIESYMGIATMLKKQMSSMRRVISVDIPLLWKALFK